MDLRRQGQIVRSWIWLLVASLLLAGGAAYLVSSALPKVYEATATLLVGQSNNAGSPNYNDLLASQRISQTYANLATTGPILTQVIADAGLDVTPTDFARNVTAEAARDSTLVTVTVQDGDPQQAADLANAIATQMIAASDTVYGKSGQVQEFVAGQIEAAQNQITETQTEIDRLAGLPSRSAAEDQQLEALQGRVATLRQSYAALMDLSGSAANAITVVDPATPPEAPSSPRVLLNTILAAMVGVLLAVAIVYTLEYLDDTVKTSEDVEMVTGLPTLGAIIKIKGGKASSEMYRLVTLLYPRGPAAEAYRTLRSNLEFAAVAQPVRTLLVTSSIPGEGKTTTASNLAVVFAQAGRKVILLDADLRKPGVHKFFNVPNERGLSTLLRHDTVALEDVAQETEQENLAIVTTGPLPPNPAELLASQRMQAVLERLKGVADLVILDSPPLQAVTDAALLASITDGTLLIIDSGRTRRTASAHGRESLAKADARVLGAALNRISTRAGGDYIYYDYYGADSAGSTAAGTAALGPASKPTATSAVDASGGLTGPRS
jgi:tyrosine-protein kinase